MTYDDIKTGFHQIFGEDDPDNTEAGRSDLQQSLPTLVYYSRKRCGTPKISPKAGNMCVQPKSTKQPVFRLVSSCFVIDWKGFEVGLQ